MYGDYVSYRESQIKETIGSMIEGFIGIDNLQTDFNTKCIKMFTKTNTNQNAITTFLAQQSKTGIDTKVLFPIVLLADCIFLECLVLHEFHNKDLNDDTNENMITCLFCSNIINYILKENFNSEVKKEIAKCINNETTKTSIRNVKLHVSNENQEDTFCYEKHFKNNLNRFIKILENNKQN